MQLFLDISDWFLLFGRFHPLVVHLPIGFLLMAFLLELFARFRKNVIFSQVIDFVLWFGFGSAVLACLLGYLLSLGSDYDENALTIHQFLGIALTILTGIVLFLKKQNTTSVAQKAYFPAFSVSVLLLTLTGHYGGNLTHGSDYLTQPLQKIAGITPKTEKPKPQNPSDLLAYDHVVEPILAQKCYSCHNAEKQKGKLRMDTEELLVKGGKHGAIFVAGKSLESEMMKRVLLPESDENHMPPKGKTPLTEEEIALVKWWIDAGADFTKKATELQASEEVKKLLAFRTGGGVSETTPKKESEVFSRKFSAADPKLVQELRQAGILVTPIASGQNFLEVSFVNAGNKADEMLTKLTALSEQIVWLKLGSSNISDKGLTAVSKLKNLTKLGLENTRITDAGLTQLGNLTYLEYLNLYGTKITDTGILQITSLKNLRNLYVWQTQVTEKGIVNLKKQLPQVEVNTGWKEEKTDSSKVATANIH